MPFTLAIKKDINRESDVHTLTSIATFDRGYTRNTQQTYSRIAHLKRNRCQIIISSQKCLSFTWTHRSITRDRSKSTLLGKSTRTHFSRSDVSRSAKIGRFISRIGKKCRKSVRYVWLLASRRQHRHPLSLARRRLKSSQIEERAIIHRWGREGRGCRRYQADENRCAMVERGDIFWNNEYVLPGPIEVKPPSLVIRLACLAIRYITSAGSKSLQQFMETLKYYHCLSPTVLFGTTPRTIRYEFQYVL